MKISEYLKNEIQSHSIYMDEAVKNQFKEATGLEPCWPSYTHAETLAMIENRGLGGSLSNDTTLRFSWGYEIAESLAYKYANYDDRGISGRGFRFRLAIETLEKAGY